MDKLVELEWVYGRETMALPLMKKNTIGFDAIPCSGFHLVSATARVSHQNIKAVAPSFCGYFVEFCFQKEYFERVF